VVVSHSVTMSNHRPDAPVFFHEIIAGMPYCI
jgi:hypothetical protein